MNAARLVVIAIGLLWLSACTTAKTPAPVREAGKPKPNSVATPMQPAGTHVVQAGDTLFKIAFENGLDLRDLARWNGLSDPNLIRVGQRLRLTPPSEPVASPPPARPSSTPVLPEVERWDWPARGPLLATFDEAAGRKGIQIGGQLGTPVRAAAAGRVVYAGDGLRGYGKLIIIRHGETLLSAYAHHARILVQEGQSVALGQVIGEMGDSDTDRVKLHFEIRRQGRPVDPLHYLPPQG